MPQQGYTYAAVAQVQPGASEQSVKSAIVKALAPLAEKMGEGGVEAMFGQFS